MMNNSFIRFILLSFVGVIIAVIIDALLGGTGFIFLFALAFIAYLCPTTIALARKVPSSLAVAALNILLGWTVIGFVVALVWALKKYDYVAPELKSKDN